MMTTTNGIKPINESLKEYARGIIGGLVFSLPMLYTMVPQRKRYF